MAAESAATSLAVIGDAASPEPPDSTSAGVAALRKDTSLAAKHVAATAAVMKALGRREEWENMLPEDRTRCWELIFAIRSFQNVTTNQISFFFCVCVESDDPKKHPSRVRLPTQYTTIFRLGKGEAKVPDNPIILYERKNFNLTYREMERHVVKVDMWQISFWTFNTYYGHRKEKLSDISNRDPNMDLMMKKKLSKKQQADYRSGRKQVVGDVALFSCYACLEEIFDFRLACDNWTLELSQTYKDDKIGQQRKRLHFIMPVDRRSLPGQRKFQFTSTFTTKWSKPGSYFWASCGNFVFRGTRTHLQNSFMVVAVHTGKPPEFGMVDGEIAHIGEMMQKAIPARTLGKSLMNLTSVLDISVFKGQVKAFDKDRKRYEIGVLRGNVKCLLCSRGINKEEIDMRGRRPQQPKSSTTVSHLNPAERHLVIKVRKCENLPVADADTGTSDPYLRVSWDNMVLDSPIMQATCRPVFNQTFYFPNRTVFPSLERKQTQIAYKDTIVAYELESKGHIKIEVWDDDVTFAEYLGGTVLPLADILAVRVPEIRSLIGGRVEAQSAEGDETTVEVKKAWHQKEELTRVYDGSKTILLGCLLPNNGNAFVHYEAYFYPDLFESMRLPPSQTVQDSDETWKRREIEWNKSNKTFQEQYTIPFPESIGAKDYKEDPVSKTAGSQLRRFPIIAMHPQRLGFFPLMSFLSPVIIPQEAGTPSKLLHWVYCLSFETSMKQARSGLIAPEGWKDPSYVLARRKGTIQDHAILLCSLLLGTKKDAYVCKGTIWNESSHGQGMLVEHVWVMTREAGWVTFWEPSSRQVFHLPKRYTVRKNNKKQRAARLPWRSKSSEPEDANGEQLALPADEDNTQDGDEEGGMGAISAWDGEVVDARIGIEEMENLPTVGRQPKPKMRVQGKKKETERREALRKQMIKNRASLSFAPNKDMLQSETLCTWLPYDSIDVVFNHQNLWANRQNHHPACITYDFPGSDEEEEESEAAQKWQPLNTKAKSIAFSPVAPNVSVQPPLRSHIIDALAADLRTEMIQNLSLYRGKKGYDCLFDHAEELTDQLTLFLDIQEMWFHVDSDNPNVKVLLETPAEKLTKEKHFMIDMFDMKQCNSKGSPFFADGVLGYEMYRAEQTKLWATLEESVRKFTSKLDTFPTKRGMKFRGFPTHFSTSDHEQIRTHLMELQQYKQFIDIQEEDIYYSIACQIYPLMAGCLSVWLYIGIQEHNHDTEYVT